jgi:methylated-DNA-[protein]-cysteine S-methyltransferase
MAAGNASGLCSAGWSEAYRQSLTPFQARVYQRLCDVPRGKVTTYGRLAAAVGCNSAQAVGQALRCNPFAPMVPCHRVVCSDLSLGGFCGSSGAGARSRKRRLLEAEGVRVHGGRVASSTYVHDFWR